MSGEHKQDYVCSLCCEGHHDRCLGDTDNRCDCVDCYRAEVERLRDRAEAAEALLSRLYTQVNRGYLAQDLCRAIDAALDAKGVE